MKIRSSFGKAFLSKKRFLVKVFTGGKKVDRTTWRNRID